MPFHPSIKNSHDKEVDLLVQVYTRPNLRSDDMLVYIGQSVCRNCFDDLEVDQKTTKIAIEYPERWCNILELRQLVKRILDYYPNVENITIKTHSVYIIQCTQAAQIRIYDKSGDYPENEVSSKTRYCPHPHQQQGLQIFGGSKH
jgi:hypothetical protein